MESVQPVAVPAAECQNGNQEELAIGKTAAEIVDIAIASESEESNKNNTAQTNQTTEVSSEINIVNTKVQTSEAHKSDSLEKEQQKTSSSAQMDHITDMDQEIITPVTTTTVLAMEPEVTASLPIINATIASGQTGLGTTMESSTQEQLPTDSRVENETQRDHEMNCDIIASTEEIEATTSSSNGLGLIAAYTSDTDTDGEGATYVADSDDNVIEVPTSKTITDISTVCREVVNVTSGSDSSDSSGSDSDSEAEYLTVLRKKIDKRINTEDCDEDDDDFEDDARPRRRQQPKVRGEMTLDDLPPIHQLEITVPEDECIELGKVQSIVDQLVLVSVLPNSMLFDLDTVLFLEKGRKVLGQVFDVLGQVADPLYCVRFNSNEQIKERGINIGDIVYCAPQTEHTQFVILSKLMQIRGSDASWEHDVEPPARYIDYSDDEQEREARIEQRKKRQRDRVNSTDSVETNSTVTVEIPDEAPPPPRQRGRRAQRGKHQSNGYQNGSEHAAHNSRSQSRDSEYNYHPSYNPGSWHSNYYHNYHPPAANFNMMPGMAYPMPTHNFSYMPPPHPYAMPPPMHMPMPPTHIYPHSQPNHFGHSPRHQQRHPPNSGN